MADARKQLGEWGERLAAGYLQRAGYEIIATNWRCQAGEIDLVARSGDTLIFVEVKTRRGDQWGAPEEAVTAHKSRKLRLLAQHYLLESEQDGPYRIDVVAVELDRAGRFLRCEHYPGAVGDE
jgi:putative endonuclease